MQESPHYFSGYRCCDVDIRTGISRFHDTKYQTAWLCSLSMCIDCNRAFSCAKAGDNQYTINNGVGSVEAGCSASNRLVFCLSCFLPAGNLEKECCYSFRNADRNRAVYVGRVIWEGGRSCITQYTGFDNRINCYAFSVADRVIKDFLSGFQSEQKDMKGYFQSAFS